MHIAMWSPPRTVSTALMRSWGNRADTSVCDEPLYAYYLKTTGLPHPLAEEIIAEHDHDICSVLAWLTGPVPAGRTIFYQKHMAHHLLSQVDRAWLSRVINCFLIRDPREMLPSYVKKNGLPRFEDTGFPQMHEIFQLVRSQTATIPPVIDSRELLQAPRRTLQLLCDRLEVPFTESMLQWPAGPRATDGVWAKHWYSEVVRTTTFGEYRQRHEPIPSELKGIAAECEAIYQDLFRYRRH